MRHGNRFERKDMSHLRIRVSGDEQNLHCRSHCPASCDRTVHDILSRTTIHPLRFLFCNRKS